ncbi:MAG TPA: UDP-glucose/GDP-mannose dehydrogenase family protein [Actinomycetota bacterium]
MNSIEPSVSAVPRIAVVGNGYVGSVVSACFAALGRDVVGLEVDRSKLRSLRAGRAPLHEEGLDELLTVGIETGRLRFTDDVGEAVATSDVIFLCVGTPANGAGADLHALESVVRAIGATVEGDRVLVTKSTVPVGTVAWLGDVLEESVRRENGRPVGTFSLVANPEFLRQGTAVSDFLHPRRVILGGEDPLALEIVAEVYRPILRQGFPGGDPARLPGLVRTTLASAEAVKYASNAFLAAKVSFINEVANICDRLGADVTVVAEGMGMDPRIGPEFLSAGIGWGGSCFGKDLDALIHAARAEGYEPELLHAVAAINRRQRSMAIEKLRDLLGGLEGRRVALLGLAFKPGTDDVRDAPALDLGRWLLDAGAEVTAYDPVVREVSRLPEVKVAPNAYDAAADADAVVLATEWPEFEELDMMKLADQMRGDLVFDGRNALDPEAVADAGLRYEGMGRPGMDPRRVSLSMPPEDPEASVREVAERTASDDAALRF